MLAQLFIIFPFTVHLLFISCNKHCKEGSSGDKENLVALFALPLLMTVIVILFLKGCSKLLPYFIASRTGINGYFFSFLEMICSHIFPHQVGSRYYVCHLKFDTGKSASFDVTLPSGYL